MTDHVEATIQAWEEAGVPVSTEEVIRLTLDWAEANIAAHDRQIKLDGGQIDRMAARLDRIGVGREHPRDVLLPDDPTGGLCG